jgi:hypothetical protein
MLNSLSVLPLSPSELRYGIQDAVSALINRGFVEEESLLKLGYDFDVWVDDGTSRDRFPADLVLILEKASWTSPGGQTRSICYASLVAKLTGRFTKTRRDAAIILSQLPLILQLAQNFRASSARIARLMGQTEKRIAVDWRMVDLILTHFGLKSELEQQAVALLLQKDKENSDQELIDSTVVTVVEMLIGQAKNLGLDEKFQEGVIRLFTPDIGRTFIPYLQILLYISIVDHFFDHPPEFIYTFKPRGEVGNLIFGVFPHELAPGGNPMLNNFKAVNRITLDWADSRPDNREQARALVEIVEGLSSLAYSPRVQISSLLRKAIVRYIEINTPAPIRIKQQTDFEVIKRFVRGVSVSQTCTRGVIEQRVVDFLAAIEYPLPEWRSRGLGDPVNASNSSSKKLGDCDFQNISEKKCIALEAHAGRLTDVYVREHLRTLRINLRSRLVEWSLISELSDWCLHLRFLVHEDARSGVDIPVHSIVNCPVEVLTYRQYFERLLPIMESDIEGALFLFNRWVINVLDASNTPVATKQTASSLLLD